MLDDRSVNFDFERSIYDRKAIEKVSDTSSEKVEYVRRRQEDLSGGNENYTGIRLLSRNNRKTFFQWHGHRSARVEFAPTRGSIAVEWINADETR